MKHLKLFSILLGLVLCLPAFSQAPLDENGKPIYNDLNARRRALFEVLEIQPGSIVMFGDNLVDGCEWNEIFDNPKIVNRGIHGDRVAWMFDRIEAVTKAKPAKFFFMAGSQDLVHKTKSKDCVLMIAKLIQTVHQQSPQTKIYVQSILPWNLNVPAQEARQESTLNIRIDNCNKWLRNWCAGQDYTFIDVAAAMSDADGHLDARYTWDGVNLNGVGYLVWKEILDPFINE